MKYLTPEIEALSKHVEGKSLVQLNMSCGIFQECDYKEARPQQAHLKLAKD